MDSPFTDEQIDFMRADLASDMGYTRMIEATKERFKEEGRDFDAEFKRWERKKNKREEAGQSDLRLYREMKRKSLGGR